MTNIYNLNKDELVLLISEIEGRTKREYEEKINKLELEIKRKKLIINLIDPEGYN